MSARASQEAREMTCVIPDPEAKPQSERLSTATATASIHINLDVTLDADSPAPAKPAAMPPPRTKYLRHPTINHFVAKSPEEAPPCDLQQALARARDRLPHDATGRPFANLGLFTPYAVLRTLGSDAAFYVRSVQEGVALSLLLLLTLLPAIAYNMGMVPTPDYHAEYAVYVKLGLLTGTNLTDTWTANATWPGCRLGSHGPPLTWGRPGGNGELAGAPSLSWVHVICDALAMVLTVGFLVRMQRMMLMDNDVFETIAVDLRTAASLPGQGVKTAVHGVQAVIGPAASAHVASVVGAVHDACEAARACADTSAAAITSLPIVRATCSAGINLTVMARARAERLSRLRSVSQWWASSSGELQRNDMVAKACTVVLWGWGEGPIPPQALSLLGEVAGAPVAVVQAREVLRLYEARRQREELIFKLQDLVAKRKLSAKQLEAQAALQAKVAKLEMLIDTLLTENRLLPIAFVTFPSSRDAHTALTARASLRALNVKVGPAPRPTDIKWSHLHVMHKAGCKLVKNSYDIVLTLVMAVVISGTIIVATMFAQMCLFWVPFNALFTGWLPIEKLIGGLHWCWGVAMFTVAYELLNQLVALTLTDGGVWPHWLRPKALKDWYHSRTLGQLRFVKIVASTEMLAMFVGVILIHPEALDIPKTACDFTCLCWWLNPHYAVGSWYDFGAGFAFNALVNAFIGDALINSFIAPRIGLTISRKFLAEREPTQHRMEERCRARDHFYLPWRIVHLVKAWFFGIVLMPVIPFVALPLLCYFVISFAADRINMLSFLEPLPPSSGLCMRFTLTVLLPLSVPAHFVVGIIGYANCAHGVYNHHRANLLRSDKLQQEQDSSFGLVFNSAPVIAYIIFAVLCTLYFMFEIMVNQRRIAIRRGLMTPLQVFLAAFVNDEGFFCSSAAEPYPDVDTALEDAGFSEEQIAALYAAPQDDDDEVASSMVETTTVARTGIQLFDLGESMPFRG